MPGTIRGLITEHPVLVVKTPASTILEVDALENDSPPNINGEILPIEKRSTIADLHALQGRLDDTRLLRPPPSASSVATSAGMSKVTDCHAGGIEYDSSLSGAEQREEGE